MPRVSVIIPTYNRAKIVTEAIKSVLVQTERDLEVIVIDDGSTDDTGRIVTGIKDDRITYYHKKNGGAASARNLGLAKAGGDFIAFLDSDDAWPENYLEVMLASLQRKQNVDIVYSPITLVYPDGRQRRSYKAAKGHCGKITSALFQSSSVWPFATLSRAAAWKDFFFDENCRVSEDSDALLRMSLHAEFGFVPDVEAFHRISEDSLSSNTGVVCTRLLTLERFYFRLGGKNVVPWHTALRKLSHSCRAVAKDFAKKHERSAALKLYARAIKYWPFDLRLYGGYAKVAFFDKAADRKPDWQMPQLLGEPLGTHRFLREQAAP
ncbi:MAG: glycosyltransferase family 2 protein [Sedimentisphaerales bacterium]